jgi:hypothetical protein
MLKKKKKQKKKKGKGIIEDMENIFEVDFFCYFWKEERKRERAEGKVFVSFFFFFVARRKKGNGTYVLSSASSSKFFVRKRSYKLSKFLAYSSSISDLFLKNLMKSLHG